MPEKIIKYFRSQVKSVDSENHTAEVVISDESLDRYKERVMVDSFKSTIKEFMKHPVMLSSHAYRGLLNQIGVFEKITVDKKAREVVASAKWFAGEGNPEADWGWKLAEKGFAAFSIGFIAKKYKSYSEEEREESGGSSRDYTDIELLETSQVLVPANASALQKSAGEAQDPFLKDYYDEILRLASDLLPKDESPIPEAPATPATDKTEDPPPAPPAEDKGWEETDNEIRHRIKEPSNFSSFKSFMLKKDKPRVRALYGKVKGTSKWEIQSLRFPKEDGWTMGSAKKWVKDHGDSLKGWEDTLEYSSPDEEMGATPFDRQEDYFEPIVTLSVPPELPEEIKQLLIKHEQFCAQVLDALHKKKTEEAAPNPPPADQPPADDEQHALDAAEIEESLGPDKIAELKTILACGENISENDTLIKMFSEMNKDIKGVFSAQS